MPWYGLSSLSQCTGDIFYRYKLQITTLESLTLSDLRISTAQGGGGGGVTLSCEALDGTKLCLVNQGALEQRLVEIDLWWEGVERSVR